MRLEEMTTFTPDPPQDDIPVQVGECKSDEYLPWQRKEQQCQENLPREREEQQREENLPREREEYLPRECEEQRHKEHLRREREGPDREEYRVREGWEHGGSECENEGDIFNAETLLHFLKTIGEFNLSNPYLETPQTPATTDAIMSTDPCAPTIEPKATTAVPQTPTTTDATYYIHPSTHTRREEEAYAIPVTFFKPSIIPVPSTHSYAPIVESISPEVEKELKIKNPLFKKR